MKNRRKKLLSLLLAVTMLLSLFPVTALAEEGEEIIEELCTDECCAEEHEHEETHEHTPEDEEPSESPAPAEPETVAEEPLLARVRFVRSPEELSLTVFDADGCTIEPEEDGTYLLRPGEYSYTATCEGYESAENVAFTVEGDCEVEVVLEAAKPLRVAAAAPKAALGATATNLETQIRSTYTAALAKSGLELFKGYCGSYVNWQLVLLKINTEYIGSDGNREFDTYCGKEKTSGGYYVDAYPASSYNLAAALNAISDNGLNSVYNILVGFEKGTGTDGVKYGHTCFIHGIENGLVYYSESFGTSFEGKYYTEGSPIVCSISSFANYYNSKGYVLDGVIYFHKEIGYMSQCTYYPSRCQVRMTEDFRIWKLPCSSATNPDSYEIKTTKTITSNITIDVTALYKNSVTTSDHYWYQVEVPYPSSDQDKIGYVYAPYCIKTQINEESFIKQGMSYSGKALPSTLPLGKSYDVDWTVESKYLDIAKITGSIGSYSAEKAFGVRDKVKSYGLYRSPIDTGLTFNNITSEGTYPFVITLIADNYYCANNSNTLKHDTISKNVINHDILFTNASVTSYHFDLNGTLDGNSRNDIYGIGYCDIYIGGKLVDECSSDYYQPHAKGTSYKVTNIHAYDGFRYIGNASYEGTINSDTSINLKFETVTDPCTSGHSWDGGSVTQAATCTADGVKTYHCTVCTATKTEPISKLGHAYTAVTVPGNCTTPSKTVYTCSRCPDSYEEVNSSWSAWSTTKPTDISDAYIQSRTEYRISTKETATSAESSKTGWTPDGTTTQWSDYGAWSDWGDNPITANDATQVESAKVYRYYYYLCTCGDHNPLSTKCGCGSTSNTWKAKWSAIPYTSSNSSVVSYATQKRQTTSLGDGQLWYFSSGNLNATAIGTKDSDSDAEVIKTGYRSRTRTQETVYKFYRWTDWSDWSATAATASDTQQVETRTVYRYNTLVGEHSSDGGKVTKAASCTEEGVKTFTCTVCHETLKTETIPKLEHTSDGGTVTKAATCAETGTRTYKCTVCKTVLSTETIPKLTTHAWNSGTVTKAATCVETGIKTYTCSTCGATKTETISKLTTHTSDSGTVTKAATCAETGTRTYKCTVCKTVLSTETIPKLTTHAWNSGTITKAATCAEAGIKTYTCSTCGATKTETIPKLTTHTSDGGTITKAATCAETGTRTYKCTVCKTVLSTETIPARGHSYGEWITIDEDNFKRVCSVCGKEETGSHKWDSGTVSKPATCEETGEITYSCADCEATKTETIPATGHSYGETTYTWTINKDTTSCTAKRSCAHEGCTHYETIGASISRRTTTEPTCTKNGEGVYTARFGWSYSWAKTQTRTDIIPALGHDYGEPVYKWSEDHSLCYSEEPCSRCAEVYTKKGIMSSKVSKEPTCTETGEKTITARFGLTILAHKETYVEEIPATGHSYNKGKVTQAATCGEEGVMTYTCTVCKDKKTEAIPATGHDWGEVNYVWSEDHSACTATRTCINDASHTETANAAVTDSKTEVGCLVYTAVFSESWTATQTFTETVPVVASGESGDNVHWVLDDNGTLTISGTGAMWNWGKTDVGWQTAPWYGLDVKSVVIEEGVTSIGDYAFAAQNGTGRLTPCSVERISLPDTVTSIGDHAFSCCLSLSAIDVSANNSHYCSVGGVLFSKDKTALLAYPGGIEGAYSIPAGVTSIGDYAFYFCEGLTGVTIPDGVTSIGAHAFCECGSLTGAELSDSVISIGDYAFYSSGVTTLTIPDKVTSIGRFAFGGVERICVDAENSCYVAVDGILYNKAMTELIYCPVVKEGAVTIPVGVVSILEGAFEGCGGLTGITIPNSVATIGEFAFFCCDALADIYYGGTEEQWDDITKGEYAIPETATIHFTEAPEELDGFTISLPTAMSSSVTISAPKGGWVVGENTFTVECETACVLLVTNDGGQTYTRLQATASGDGHAFTADLTADSSIVCARKGDISGDGTISALEARQILMAGNGLYKLTPLQRMIADTNGDGTISALEARQILMAGNGLFTIGW